MPSPHPAPGLWVWWGVVLYYTKKDVSSSTRKNQGPLHHGTTSASDYLDSCEREISLSKPLYLVGT